MSDLHMAGGLRFADAGANHFPSFRAWPKTFGDLISSDARFVGHFESSFPWPQSILFGQARLILLCSRGHHPSDQGLAVVPRHPLRRVLLELVGVPQQF